MDVIAKIKKWYRGELVVHKNDPNSSVFIVSAGYLKQPPLAKFINYIVSFWVKHWHILLPIIIAASVALFIHFDSKENHKTSNIDTSVMYLYQFKSEPLTNKLTQTAGDAVPFKSVRAAAGY